MHGGQSRRVGELILRQRERQLIILNKADQRHSGVHLAQKVGNALDRITAADIQDPLAQNAFVHEGRPPQGLRKTVAIGGQRIQRPARDVGNTAARQRHDAMVHVAEDRDVQIAKIAGYKEGDYLSRAVRKNLVASRPAFENHMNVFGPFTLRHDIFPGRDDPFIVAKRDQTLNIGLVKVGDRRELGDQWTVAHRSTPSSKCSLQSQYRSVATGTKLRAVRLPAVATVNEHGWVHAHSPPLREDQAMPRFRFHLYNDVETLDHEGREFADFAAARAEAIGNARDLMASEIRSRGEINLSHWIELEDDDGEVVIVCFRDAVTVTT